MTDTEDSSLKWLFFDLNSYFASVEQQDRPELRGKPVAVVPLATDYTCAIAASYEAKAYGVKTGTPIKEAKKLCPDLRCVLARHDLYVAYHHRIVSEVVKHTPINKIWSIDELSSRLPPNKPNRDSAIAVAQAIKQGLRDTLGETIRCSIGVAPNSFLAKVATDMEKPDGLVLLTHASLPDRLFKLKLTDLPGININMERRLLHAGITTVEQFWNLSPRHARQVWGSVTGERFWYNLHGIEIPDLETKTTTIGHSRILDPELRAPDAARQIARRLTVKAAGRLRRAEFYATAFYFSARDNDDQRWAGEVRLPPSQDNFAFLGAIDGLWETMLGEMQPRRLKKVSITLHGLCRCEDITPDLFDTASESWQKLQRRHDDLSAVMDRINAKFGAETIRIGPSPQTGSGFVGTKIAFSRIPDQAEFFD